LLLVGPLDGTSKRPMPLYTTAAKRALRTVSVDNLLKVKVLNSATSKEHEVGEILGDGYTVLLFVRNGA